MANAAAKTKPSTDKTEAPAGNAAAPGQSDAGASQPTAVEAEGQGGGDAAPAEAPKAKKDAKAKADIVTVTTNAERGRWRIGRHFSRDATVIPAADLTAPQLEALQGDPVLIVTIGPAAIE